MRLLQLLESVDRSERCEARPDCASDEKSGLPTAQRCGRYVQALQYTPRFARFLSVSIAVASRLIPQGAPGCPSCGQLQPKYKQTGAELTVDHGKQAQDSSQRVQKLSAERVQKIFEAIPKAVIPILGFHPTEAHPAWMLLSVVPVPPMSVRPSVVLFNSANAQDDLTYALANIIRADRILRDSIECGASDHVINANLETLQCHCASLVNNNVSNVAQSCHKNGRALKSIKERLDGTTLIPHAHSANRFCFLGKEGRIRGNLMGKRVDFSARTVSVCLHEARSNVLCR